MSRIVTAGNTYSVQDCTLCATQGHVDLEVPDYFSFMVGAENRMEFSVPCACERYAAWDSLPRREIAKAYADLAACILGSADKWQWFEVLGWQVWPGLEQRYAWEQYVQSTPYVRLGYTLWFPDIENPGSMVYWDGGAETAPLPPVLYPSVMEAVWRFAEDEETYGTGEHPQLPQYEIREVVWSEDRFNLVETGNVWHIEQVPGEDFYRATFE